jgi:leucyl/phenylalanyl-tRNA--protein transferase
MAASDPMNPRASQPQLQPAQLLEAYARGWFPMGDRASRQLEWFSPDPRGVIPLDGFRVSRRLARLVRQQRFEIRIDTHFEEVVRQCAARDETWISAVIIDAYSELHALGFAHSVEAWHADGLVGGLYGVSLRGAFFGESMFHTMTDASKVALCALVAHLQERHYRLLDVQWVTPHLASFGAIEVPRRRYLAMLADALTADCWFEWSGVE